MSNEIRVGFDGSPASSNALRWAASEAEVRGFRLRVMSCFTVPITVDGMYGLAPPDAYQVAMATEEQVLSRERGRIVATRPGLEVVTEAVTLPAGPALIDGVGEDDLIVVGASAHQHAAAVLLGSTPRYVVRHGPCPVVVVRGAVESSRPARVVVGVDGSPAAAAAVNWAGDEADRHGVNLLLVHAWSYPYAPVDAASSQARDLMKIDAACLLERCVEAARERFGADVQGELVEAGPVAALLECTAAEDLLVLGSRGRGAFTTALFGSTVNSVLDESEATVVVIPRADQER